MKKGNIMFNKIRKYLEYRKNKKIIKKELAAIGASFLPIVANAGNVTSNFMSFITKISIELSNIHGETFFELLLNELSDLLKTDNERLLEILSYIAQLSPKEIQAVISDAIVNTSKK